jgi:hypothetical protein
MDTALRWLIILSPDSESNASQRGTEENPLVRSGGAFAVFRVSGFYENFVKSADL